MQSMRFRFGLLEHGYVRCTSVAVIYNILPRYDAVNIQIQETWLLDYDAAPFFRSCFCFSSFFFSFFFSSKTSILKLYYSIELPFHGNSIFFFTEIDWASISELIGGRVRVIHAKGGEFLFVSLRLWLTLGRGEIYLVRREGTVKNDTKA